MVYYRTLNILPWGIQWALVVFHPAYTDLHLKTLNSPSILPPPCFPLATTVPSVFHQSLLIKQQPLSVASFLLVIELLKNSRPVVLQIPHTPGPPDYFSSWVNLWQTFQARTLYVTCLSQHGAGTRCTPTWIRWGSKDAFIAAIVFPFCIDKMKIDILFPTSSSIYGLVILSKVIITITLFLHL